MARATQRASDAPRDAIALLKQDHRAVEALFKQFERSDDESEQAELATRVCNMLKVHTQIEEELFYPEAKDSLDEEDDEMVYEAEVEHGTAKELIAKLEGMTPDDEHFKATFTVLSEYVKHHVKEEETELFPSLRDTEMDLKELGTQLQSRKFELMDQMGIEAEEEAAPTRRRASGSRASRTASRAKGRSRTHANQRSSARH
jgi:hemerythrin-like domain-containing protein